jgi:hypothetical protein
MLNLILSFSGILGENVELKLATILFQDFAFEQFYPRYSAGQYFASAFSGSKAPISSGKSGQAGRTQGSWKGGVLMPEK